MILLEVRHFHSPAVDTWSYVDRRKDWTLEECIEFKEEQDNSTYVFYHNEYARPTYYLLKDDDSSWLELEDGSKYDYSRCEFEDKVDKCDGCDDCQYSHASYELERKQDIEYIKYNGLELLYETVDIIKWFFEDKKCLREMEHS